MATTCGQKSGQRLEPPFNHYLSFASGWFELGDTESARRELGLIPPILQTHPETLDLRWDIAAADCDWDEALLIAEERLRVCPQEPTGWIQRAYAVRRRGQGGLREAWEALLPAAQRFPQEPVVPFNLACYACQLGRNEEATRFLRIAMRLGDPKTICAMALGDDDLAPLWPAVRDWPR